MTRHLAWRLLLTGYLTLTLLAISTVSATAESVVEVPILAAIKNNDRGVFELLLLRWDRQTSPSPIELRWQGGNVRPGMSNVSSMAQAFRYAVEHHTREPLTGTVHTIGIAYAATNSDGPSAGAVMAVGFSALLNGDQIQRGIALTGTISQNGTIGPVGSIPDKVRAAAREGYRTVLIPEGQYSDPRWDLTRLGWELNVEIKEVGTIDQAYQLMTGRTLH
ncbi:MAG: S16 family serine protease [Nitrospiraceae bacterium]